jgi:hypothetical protein
MSASKTAATASQQPFWDQPDRNGRLSMPDPGDGVS